MTRNQYTTGSSEAFNENWEARSETHYVHWTEGDPKNQIQFAFRQHWLLFNELLGGMDLAGKKILEVGCGRGSLSMYFANAGAECTLLDSSESIIDVAAGLFRENHLTGTFDVGDALKLPYEDNYFDVVFSIGLLEHFDEVKAPLEEQLRVLKTGGTLFVYVVPQNDQNLQQNYEWINAVLKTYHDDKETTELKEDVYRTEYLAPHYLKALKEIGYEHFQASDVYSVPMISHSPDFPFSLNQPAVEEILVKQFSTMVAQRKEATGVNGWRCEAGQGQAFLVWGQK